MSLPVVTDFVNVTLSPTFPQIHFSVILDLSYGNGSAIIVGKSTPKKKWANYPKFTAE